MVAPESGDAGNKGDGGEGKVYHGSCRCGAAQIAVRLRGPLDESYKEPVLECNCSICQRVSSLPCHDSLIHLLQPPLWDSFSQ